MRFSIGLVIVCAALFCTVKEVSAEDLRPVQADIALDGKLGSESNSFEWSGFLGHARTLHTFSGRWKLYGAAGAHAGWGAVDQDDRRAVDGKVRIDRYSLGGEARVGLYYGERWPKFYTYVGGGPTYYLAAPTSDRLAEAGGSGGYRGTFGVAWPGSWKAIMDGVSSGSCDGGSCGLILLAYLIPNKIQISYEQIAGADENAQRLGGGFGWSF